MNEQRKLRVLIVDDERAARQRLEDLLLRKPNVEIVGQAGTGRDAVEAINTQRPDLVFLDVQMPGLTGMEVVQEVGPERMPAVVFVTAYDQYAVKAFDVAALDYILKPFDDDRFDQAFERARETAAVRELTDLRSRLVSLLRGTSEQGEARPAARYAERIAVEMRGQMRIVPVQTIDFVTASGSYAELHVGEDTFVIREQMQNLEDRLNPDHFFRIHRSTIVQLDRIDALLYSEGGSYAVRLKDGKRLKVSRSRYEALQKHLGLDTQA